MLHKMLHKIIHVLINDTIRAFASNTNFGLVRWVLVWQTLKLLWMVSGKSLVSSPGMYAGILTNA